jgi:hypothetical protein
MDVETVSLPVAGNQGIGLVVKSTKETQQAGANDPPGHATKL